MSKVPSANYEKVFSALKRDGEEVLKITVPAHRPIKRSTLSHILKQAHISVDKFLDLL